MPRDHREHAGRAGPGPGPAGRAVGPGGAGSPHEAIGGVEVKGVGYGLAIGMMLGSIGTVLYMAVMAALQNATWVIQ